MIGIYSCKKYPEDPLVHFFTDNFEGVTRYVSIIIDNKDVTHLYSDSLGLDIKSIKLKPSSSGSSISHTGLNFTLNTGIKISELADIFISDAVICVDSASDTASNLKCLWNLYADCVKPWKIRRTMGTIVVEREKNGKKYRITFGQK